MLKVTEAQPQWGVNLGMGFNAFTVREHDFVAAGIRWFERWDNIEHIPVSHAFIVSGPDETIEAFSDGVKRGTLSVYLNDPNIALLTRKPRHWSPEMGTMIVAEAAKHIGDKYGYSLIVGMAIANSFIGRGLDLLFRKKRFTNFVTRIFENKKQEICSELVARADNAAPEIAGKGILSQAAFSIKPVDLIGDHEIYECGAWELIPPKG